MPKTKPASKVHIILAVYNGEKYLRELLDSLFAQTYNNIEIFARDDNSKDNSLKILKEYNKKKVKGKKLTLVPTGKSGWGYPDCFWKLLKIAKGGDYYFYCDQDDVWLPNKVEQAVKKFETLPPGTPAAHIGTHYFCTENLDIIRTVTAPQDTSLTHAIYNNWTLGFNLSFNKALYDILVNTHLSTFNHDYWTAFVAASTGVILRSETPSVKYRRIETSMTSFNRNQLTLFLWRVKEFLFKDDKLKRIKEDVTNCRKQYDKYLSDSDKKMLDVFTVDTPKNRFKRIFYPHRLRTTIPDEFFLRTLFLIGKL